MKWFSPRDILRRQIRMEIRIQEVSQQIQRIASTLEITNQKILEDEHLIRELRSVVVSLDSSRSDLINMRLDDLWGHVSGEIRQLIGHLDTNFEGLVSYIDQIFRRFSDIENMTREVRETLVQLDRNKSRLISDSFSGLVDGVAISISSRIEQEFEQLKADIADARQSIIGKMS